MIEAPRVQANGAAIPAVGLGTWQLSGEICERAVACALGIGYRHLDTATLYGNETEVGAALKASGVARDDVFVTTKVWLDDVAPGDLERSAEGSLKRLGLSCVDLLLIHWPNSSVPLARSTAALCRAKAQGLARHIGVSNYPVALMEEAIRLATEPLAVNQVEHHPRLDQRKLLAACRRHGLALVSYCPLGRGDFVADPVVQRIAAERGRTPAQVILRWHVQQPGVAAIPKSGHPGRIAENLAVFDFALTDPEMAAVSGLRRPDGRMVDPGFAPRWDEAA